MLFLLKLFTSPFWFPFWAVGTMLKARSVVRTGRKVYPVREVRPQPQVTRVTYMLPAGTPQRPDVHGG